MTVGSLLASKSVAVVCGSGGVGKTTTAAALAVTAAAKSERRVLVITIDPARRLADVMGMPSSGNDTLRVKTDGQLFAKMLDTKLAWDDMVHRHAPDDETARRILKNPLYEEITSRFVQSHDYIAMDTLHDLRTGGDYDLIVVDTPPVSQAVDFLDAPSRMASFFDSKLLKFLVAPTRSSLLNFTSRAFLQLADRLFGRRFLEDMSELFSLLETMRPGFIERANEVDDLLRAQDTTFVVVSTPEPAPCKSMERFVDELLGREMSLGAVILNKVLPSTLSDSDAITAAQYIVDDVSAIAASFEVPSAAQRVLTAVGKNFERFTALSNSERAFLSDLAGKSTARASVPWLPHEPDDIQSLRRLGETLWE